MNATQPFERTPFLALALALALGVWVFFPGQAFAPPHIEPAHVVRSRLVSLDTALDILGGRVVYDGRVVGFRGCQNVTERRGLGSAPACLGRDCELGTLTRH